MRILVTGGVGVNGAVVTRKLLARDIAPIVVDRRADFSLVSDIEGQFEFAELDITNFDAVERFLTTQRIDRIIHLAAFIDPNMDTEPFKSFQVNASGTVNLLEAAKRAGVKRFIYASSRAVYGELPENVGSPGYRLISEDHPKNPLLSYDATKLAAENLGQVYRTVFGLEFAALRFSAIYGPGKQARHGKMSLRSRLVEDPFCGKAVHLQKGGDQIDDLIYVEDAAEGMVSAALAEQLPHAAYNIASGAGCTLRQFADAVRAAIPGTVIEIGPGLNPLGFSVNRAGIFDTRRAQADFGFKPKFDLTSGVKDYVEALRRLER
ncbi:MAG: NAD-dependent epimerase/dehydratase family protein [Rhodospirillales bacterium]|jgi:UDP-glucose 4-epimerase